MNYFLVIAQHLQDRQHQSKAIPVLSQLEMNEATTGLRQRQQENSSKFSKNLILKRNSHLEMVIMEWFISIF